MAYWPDLVLLKKEDSGGSCMCGLCQKEATNIFFPTNFASLQKCKHNSHNQFNTTKAPFHKNKS
jgi:hypothetical protein